MKNEKRYRRYKAQIRNLSKFGTILSSVCPNCNSKNIFYYDRFDAECCLSCDTWLEESCGDSSCPYCSKRPATPSEAFFSEEIQYDKYRKDNLRIKYHQRYSGKLKHENSELTQKNPLKYMD